MPVTATTAINAARSPYSSRSCPSFRRTRRPIAVITCAMSLPFENAGAEPPPLPVQLRGERPRDVGEDRLNVGAGQRDGAHTDEREDRKSTRLNSNHGYIS